MGSENGRYFFRWFVFLRRENANLFSFAFPRALGSAKPAGAASRRAGSRADARQAQAQAPGAGGEELNPRRRKRKHTQARTHDGDGVGKGRGRGSNRGRGGNSGRGRGRGRSFLSLHCVQPLATVRQNGAGSAWPENRPPCAIAQVDLTARFAARASEQPASLSHTCMGVRGRSREDEPNCGPMHLPDER